MSDHLSGASGTPDDTAGLPPAPEVVQMEVGLLQNFCEILYCPETHEAAIVDPAWEVDRLLNEAGRRGLKVDDGARHAHPQRSHRRGRSGGREDRRGRGRQPARGGRRERAADAR